MAPLTFADTHNMVAFLTKSNVSAGFDQIVDFLNAHIIQYALVVNPTIYVLCIKQFWATATIKKVNDIVQLRALIDGKKVVVTEDFIRSDIYLDYADGVEYFPNEEIFVELAPMGAKRTAWNEFSCSMASAVICLATGKGFSGVETPLFASMLVQPQPVTEEEEDVDMPIALAPPSPTNAPSPPPQDPTRTPHATPHASPPSPSQEQPSSPHDSTIPLLTTLMKTCKEVRKEKEIKAFRVQEAEKGWKIEAIDADEDITLVDVETQVDIDVELQGRIDQNDDNTATKDVSAAEPNVFDDEEYDDKEENIDWNAVVEQVQERYLDNIRKYQNLKRKHVSIAQARKNMIIYLKNMAGYKMKHFRGMTYDKVRPIFEREYKKVLTVFKPVTDVEEPKKKSVAEETLLQESFKKLKAVEVSGFESTQETPSTDPKEISKEDVQNMLEIISVSEF
nr:hypothetical protein [Tanacetum cinerariifolium]